MSSRRSTRPSPRIQIHPLIISEVDYPPGRKVSEKLPLPGDGKARRRRTLKGPMGRLFMKPMGIHEPYSLDHRERRKDFSRARKHWRVRNRKNLDRIFRSARIVAASLFCGASSGGCLRETWGAARISPWVFLDFLPPSGEKRRGRWPFL